MNQNSDLLKEDRRKEPRYQVNNAAIVSFGERKGKVVDVSKGGIGVIFDDNFDDTIGAKHPLDIELYGVNFPMLSVPVNSISYRTLKKGSTNSMRPATKCGFEFGAMKPQQQSMMEYFIWDCTDAYIVPPGEV